MQKVLLLAMTLLMSQQATSWAQRIGLLNKLYEAHAETQMATELQLTAEQIAELAEHNSKFRRDQRGLIREIAALDLRRSPDGEVPWEQLWPRVKVLNAEIVSNTKAAVGSQATYARYSQLLTQKYLRESRFEEAAALHGQHLTAELRRNMHELLAELRSNQSERIAQASWDVLTEVLTVFLDRGQITAASGRALPLARLPKPQRRDVFGLYDGLPLRLAMAPEVQVELGFTPEQSQRIAAFHAATREAAKLDELLAKFQQALRQEDVAVLDAAEKQLAQGVEQLNQEIASGVQQRLEPAQRPRFDQLLFQQYVRQQELRRALILAGVSADRFDRLKHPHDPLRRAFNRHWDDAKLHLRYLRQLDQLNTAAEVFDLVVGDGITKELIGKISLAPEDPFLQDEALRKRLTKAFRARAECDPAESPVSSRRRDREDGNR